MVFAIYNIASNIHLTNISNLCIHIYRISVNYSKCILLLNKDIDISITFQKNKKKYDFSKFI